MTVPTDADLHTLLAEAFMVHNYADKVVLGRHGLRRPRYFLLHHMYHEPGLTLGRLSQLALIELASASRMIFSLEKEGMVERTEQPHDRRQFTLALTEKGCKFFESVRDDLNTDIKNRFSGLSDAEKEEVLAIGSRVRDLLTQHVASFEK